jgi:hypothetical protein
MMPRFTELVAICCVTIPLAAQSPSPQLHVDSGTVVRLHFMSGGTMAGRLLAPFAPDSTAWVYCPYGTAFCHPDGELRRLVTPAGAVAAVDVRRGSRVGSGLLAGAAIGLAAALADCGIEHLGGNTCNWKEFPGNAVPIMIGTAALGGVVGLLRPRWRRA